MYEFGDVPAVQGKFTLTNTIFSAMDENLNPDSASQFVFDYNYYNFGLALAPEDVDDIDELYGATNTVVTDPVFADTANGAWDLTLQNEAELMGSDNKPIGDPRWWKGSYPGVSVQDKEAEAIAEVYAYSNTAVIKTNAVAGAIISVYSITGSLVHTVAIESQRTELELPQGLYIIKVDTDAGSMARKVISQ